ncbi:hypothetical protein DFH06DRAFT_1331794 [Mycena polygramma]|nr:hypothetical protein DFH06DRAFT_1331794 [Mycena polygramma]
MPTEHNIVPGGRPHATFCDIAILIPPHDVPKSLFSHDGAASAAFFIVAVLRLRAFDGSTVLTSAIACAHVGWVGRVGSVVPAAAFVMAVMMLLLRLAAGGIVLVVMHGLRLN